MGDVFDDKIAPYVLGHEGGYVNDPHDAGGETNWGITIGTARANGYSGAMKNMTRDQALAIYKTAYWQKPNFYLIAGHSLCIGRHLFDCGVNMGVAKAGMFLQTALNIFNRHGGDYSDVTVDGKCGPATITALFKFLDMRGALGEQVMMRAIEAQQGADYIRQGVARPLDEDYEFGWFANRLEGKYDATLTAS